MTLSADQPTSSRYHFLARFGAVILAGGIATVPLALYTHQAELQLSPQETWFTTYILAHRWTDELPYPSLHKMAELTGVSYRVLHKYKDSLVEKGYLEIRPRHLENGAQTSSGYDFSNLFEALEKLLSRDRDLPPKNLEPTPAVEEDDYFTPYPTGRQAAHPSTVWDTPPVSYGTPPGEQAFTPPVNKRSPLELDPGNNQATTYEPGYVVVKKSTLGGSADAPPPPGRFGAPKPGTAKPAPKPNCLAEVIDLIREGGGSVYPNSADGQAVKQARTSPQLLADAYLAVYRGTWGDDWMRANLSLRLVVSRLAGFEVSRQAPPRQPARDPVMSPCHRSSDDVFAEASRAADQRNAEYLAARAVNGAVAS